MCHRLLLLLLLLLRLLLLLLLLMHEGDEGYYINTLPVGGSLIPIQLTNVICTGEEQLLTECPALVIAGNPQLACNHEDDVRLVCLTPDRTPG